MKKLLFLLLLPLLSFTQSTEEYYVDGNKVIEKSWVVGKQTRTKLETFIDEGSAFKYYIDDGEIKIGTTVSIVREYGKYFKIDISIINKSTNRFDFEPSQIEVIVKGDIRKKDKFQIMYEVYLNEKKEIVETGEILYANLKLSGQNNSLYYFDSEDSEGHYDKNGKSVQKALMKTPINGSRLSSSFGMRKHPILGYNKMHRGTDFAASSGTPIMASGSGTVTRARWCGGGGNCVKIKHNSTYETIYAHMKAFAKGIKEGRKVKQGQIIGYVGSTGLSTGPHLHYEVIVNGKKVNSQKLKLPSGKILKGEERKQFELDRIKIDLKLSDLR